jgi:hypothetical protein
LVGRLLNSNQLTPFPPPTKAELVLSLLYMTYSVIVQQAWVLPIAPLSSLSRWITSSTDMALSALKAPSTPTSKDHDGAFLFLRSRQRAYTLWQYVVLTRTRALGQQGRFLDFVAIVAEAAESAASTDDAARKMAVACVAEGGCELRFLFGLFLAGSLVAMQLVMAVVVAAAATHVGHGGAMFSCPPPSCEICKPPTVSVGKENLSGDGLL